MLPSFKNYSDLINNAVNEDLYFQLIKQLNKDFNLANINFSINENINPIQLKIELENGITDMLTEKPKLLTNFLYITDINTNNVKGINTEEITFLILKRIWKKVWYRAKFSN